MHKEKYNPGYYMQINHQNCKYDIRLNDIPFEKYTDPYPVYSQRASMNYDLLKSGEVTLSIRVLPFTGNTISKRADIQISVLRYPNMLDIENEYGGSTEIMNWELPQILDSIPIIRFDTIFKIDLPYEIKTLDNAMNLNDIDTEVLTTEVLSEVKNLHNLIKTDYDSFNKIHLNNESKKRLLTTGYFSEEFAEELYLDNKASFESPEYAPYIQDIKDFKLKIYAEGKLVTLERLKDGGNIIWCKDPITEEESISLPIFLYKDKRELKWHTW